VILQFVGEGAVSIALSIYPIAVRPVIVATVVGGNFIGMIRSSAEGGGEVVDAKVRRAVRI
jgi:hypothetical protein